MLITEKTKITCEVCEEITYPTIEGETVRCGNCDVFICDVNPDICADCGRIGAQIGHMDCEYPQDH